MIEPRTQNFDLRMSMMNDIFIRLFLDFADDSEEAFVNIFINIQSTTDIPCSPIYRA